MEAVERRSQSSRWAEKDWCAHPSPQELRAVKPAPSSEPSSITSGPVSRLARGNSPAANLANGAARGHAPFRQLEAGLVHNVTQHRGELPAGARPRLVGLPRAGVEIRARIVGETGAEAVPSTWSAAVAPPEPKVPRSNRGWRIESEKQLRKQLSLPLHQPLEPRIPPQWRIKGMDAQERNRDGGRDREQVLDVVQGGIVLPGPYIDLNQVEQHSGSG